MVLQNENFIRCASSVLKKYFLKVNPEARYWSGRNWQETMAYRLQNPLTDATSKDQIRKVLHWGGIYRFNQYDEVPAAVAWLENTEKETPKNVSNAIASYTKLFSFYNPDKYFILDARVLFSLNAMLLAYRQQTLAENESIPENALISFPFKNRTRNGYIIEHSKLFYDVQRMTGGLLPYRAYNNLILRIHEIWKEEGVLTEESWPGTDRPEIVEMLMFYYFKEIFEACT
ncbi:MAG: hypothetical protein RLY31_2788 [Bacteroidota bacterium]